MKRSHFVVALLSSLALAVAFPGVAAAGGWKRVWVDEFHGRAGSGVDRSVWKYDTGQGIFGTGEIETMTDSPAGRERPQ